MTPASALAEARRLLMAAPARAADLARRAAEAMPTSAEARFTLGAALRRAGEAEAALAVLTPLDSPLAQAWGFHFERGAALAALGHTDAAIAALGRAVALNPNSALALHALADQFALADRDEDAEALQRKPVPGGARDLALVRPALRAFDGDEAARDLLRTRFGLADHDPLALSLLAEAALTHGRADAAEALLRRAMDAAPRFDAARLRLAALLHRLERDAEAQALLAAVANAPGAAWLALRAAIALRCGDVASALADGAEALRRRPEHAPTWHAHGHALRIGGFQAGAVDAYRRALGLAPRSTEPWWSLANLKTWHFTPDDIAGMEEQLADITLPDAERAHLHFALGKAREDEGRYEAAFRQYASGNRIRRAQTPFDIAAHEDFVRRTIATFDPAFLAARAGSGFPAPDPIFIVGLPRSGSTLIEQILASHGLVEGTAELPTLTTLARGLDRPGAPQGMRYPELLAHVPLDRFTSLGQAYIDATAKRRTSNRPYFTDKFPGNALHAGLIHLMLPRARIIDLRRDPRDCCVSLFAQSFATGQGYSYDLACLGRYVRAYDDLMAHFDAVLPGRILRVHYEDLVEDCEGVTRRVLDHCDLPFDPACLRFFDNPRAVHTASSEQVRRPVNRDGIGRWRRFAPWLDELLLALQQN